MNTRDVAAVSLLAALGLSLVPSPPPRAVEPEARVEDGEAAGNGRPKQEPGFRSIDGSGNNPDVPALNAARTRLGRRMAEAYPDGISQMAGPALPSARMVSNVVAAQQEAIFNEGRASDYVWQWGQFLAHDIVLTEAAVPAEAAAIPVPVGDPFFDPEQTGTAVIPFTRSSYEIGTGTDVLNPRQQLNLATGWIDASHVYGPDQARADALRTLDGTGRLKTSDGALLPFNVHGLPNTGGPGPELFLAGDLRANEQVALTALHTLFVREHNRLAVEIAAHDSSLGGEEIYQLARRIVAAQIQVITYREFLPALLGDRPLKPYRGYDPAVDAAVTNEFATAVFRLGHSMLGRELRRVDAQGREIEAGHLPLRDAFFAPGQIVDHGIEPLLRGLATQESQAVDSFVVDEVRNFLFGPPGAGGFDLAAMNIQRGRDHGLPGYNEARVRIGLARADSFVAMSSNTDVQVRLAAIYQGVDDVDLWVGNLAEDRLPGAMVGELAFAMLKEQFEALRDGDRFWYARDFRGNERRRIEATTLADIIRRNTSIGRELHNDVFRVHKHKP